MTCRMLSMNPLKKWREAKGWTQQELADHLGITREAVSKWELGLAIPKAQALLAIAELTGIHPVKLLVKLQHKGVI